MNELFFKLFLTRSFRSTKLNKSDFQYLRPLNNNDNNNHNNNSNNNNYNNKYARNAQHFFRCILYLLFICY